MGKLLATRERVTIAIELSRVLGAPALLWDEDKKDWVKSTRSVREMFMHILWIRLCHVHPELGDADLYENIVLTINPQTLCVELELVKKQPAPKVSEIRKPDLVTA